MNRVWLVVMIALCAVASSASAGTVYVSVDSPGPVFDGASWATAFHKVQDGLNAAQAGDEVWVAAGTYVENLTIQDKVGLYGGFAGDESSRNQRDFRNNTTILDGNKANSVILAPDTSVATVVDGFTIRNGRATYGGGIYGFSSLITIANNIITGNSATSGGGGVTAYAPTVKNNTITGNSAGSGGGVYVGGNAIISGNTISSNTATYGGGIYCSQYSPKVLNNVICNNTASSMGGGMYLYHSGGIIANNLIYRNDSDIYGGGIHCEQNTSIIANNTIAMNTATSAGGGMNYSTVSYVTDPHPVVNNVIAFNSSGIRHNSGTIALSHNCVYGNTAYNYSNVSPGLTDFQADPKFVDAAADNYHLQLDSSCLDMGDDSMVKPEWLDMDEEARIQSDHVDVGADEVDRSRSPYVRMPVFSVETGLCPPGQLITITCPTDGAVIHYTTNGLEPTEGDAVIESGGSVTVTGASMTLMAKAWKEGYVTSSTKFATYTVADTVAMPEVTPDGGYYERPLQVTISCATTGAYIRYTTDGSEPTETSPNYVSSGSSITLSGPVVLKVGAFKQGMIASPVKSSTFTMRSPTILRVNLNAAGTPQDGYSWDTAYKAIQPAVDAAIIGDEIWVAAGTYTGTCNLKGDVSLYGGFAGSETQRTQRDMAANVTTLNANGENACIEYPYNIKSNTVLDGFTITGSRYYAVRCSSSAPTISGNRFIGTAGQAISGGGPTVVNNRFTGYTSTAVSLSSLGTCLVRGNTFDHNRAALSCGGACVITGNTFTQNGEGGNSTGTAIYCTYIATITGNIITNNTGWRGSAIYCSSNCTIANNIIAGNYTKTRGVIDISGAQSVIANNTIVRNTGDAGTSAIYVSSQSGTYVRRIANNIICFNTAGINTLDANLDLWNNCLYSNGVYDFSGIEDKIGVNGNISSNPLIACMAQGDFHIQPNSPCINAGEDAFVTDGDLDTDDEARIAPGGAVDIGADESYGQSYPFAAMPEFSVIPGVYTSPQNVTISSATPDATIYYTKDGNEPSTSSLSIPAGGSVFVEADCTLKAMSWKDGLAQSDTASAAYRITGTVETPVFTPSEGSFDKVETIQITCATPGATIRYTTDGSEPTEQSTAGTYVTVDRAMTVKAKAWKQDYITSATAQATYEMRSTVTHRVDRNAGGSTHDGTTWQTAFTSIADALDASIPGDEIWVAQGVYYEQFSTPYTVNMYGGFKGTENVRSERNVKEYKSILRASGQGSIVTIPKGVATRIDGFTIIGAYSSYGITCNSTSAVIANSRIAGNTDGGVLVTSYDGMITPLIVNNVIAGNPGKGIHAGQYSAPVVCNNTIVGNSGEGCYFTQAGSTCVVTNNIIAFNKVGVSGANYGSFNNNCFYGNVSKDVDTTGVIGTSGNTNADPKLVSIFYGDLHIQGDSPCVNAGLDSAVSELTDIDLQPRTQGGHVDIGAYESDSQMLVVTPRIIRVRPDGSDTNDGHSWATAKQTIGAAITALPEGGEIWVQAGQYLDISVITPNVHIYGGFAGNESSRTQRDFKANQTIITRSGGYFRTGLMEGTIDGFTIRNATNNIYTTCTNSRATIRNNTYTDSKYGGISCEGATAVIENNVFARNSTAMHCSGSTVRIVNNLLYGNTQNGIDCYFGCSATIVGNTVVGIVHSTSCNASGISFTNNSATLVAGNIIVYNRTGVMTSQPSPGAGSAVFSNNCIFGNTYSFSGITNPIGTNGNIAADPLFMDDASGDFSLKPNSPCVDTGDTADTLASDLAGTPRPLDGNGDGVSRSDMGSYEYIRGFQSTGEIKGLEDGSLVSLTGLVSTACFQDRFYAEAPTRISGIGVMGVAAPAGRYVTIEGHMTTVDGERVVSAHNVIQGEQTAVPAPWFMNPNAIGGGQLGLQAGVSDWRMVKSPETDQWERKLVTSGGASNIGLLIKATGRVSYVDAHCFYVDAGGAFDDGNSEIRGIRVLRLSSTSYAPQVGDYVTITGISSCFGMEGVNGSCARLIRPVSVELITK